MTSPHQAKDMFVIQKHSNKKNFYNNVKAFLNVTINYYE